MCFRGTPNWEVLVIEKDSLVFKLLYYNVLFMVDFYNNMSNLK